MKVEISNNPHFLPDDDDDDDVSFSPQNDNRPFPCLETPSEEQEHHEQASLSECFFHKKGKESNNCNSCYQKSSARNKPLIGGSSSWSDISECIRRPLKSNILFSSFQEIVSPLSLRSQMNLPSVSNNSLRSGSFHSVFRQSPYCSAQSNQNYYRRIIIRPHSHGEHDKNSSIHVAQASPWFNRPSPPLPYVVSPHSYLPPIHFGVPFLVPGPSSTLSQPHMPLPTRPPALTVLVVKQIDHYFSEENLETDHHLKSLMDDQGWVHVHQIVQFRRISNLTKNITLILKSLIARSNVVEVKDKSIRRKNGWEKWIRKIE